jgi:hypothetical protein
MRLVSFNNNELFLSEGTVSLFHRAAGGGGGILFRFEN